jgi:hypothetical protein
MRSGIVAAAVMCIVLAGVAQAAPITYTFQATGSGTIGSTPFSGASFTITVTADTTGITVISPGLMYNPGITSTIVIAGVGSATFTDPKQVLVAQSVPGVGFEQAGGLNLLDIRNSSLATYDLASTFGPAFDPAPSPVEQFSGVATSLGPLTFSSYQNATFNSLLGGSQIPTLSLPGLAAFALLLLVGGVLLLRR